MAAAKSRVEITKEICRRRKIRIERVGLAWHLTGDGVHVIVADLNTVTPGDLKPASRWAKRQGD